MKKAIIVLLVILLIPVVGCGKKGFSKEEKIMKEYATDYYEKYMSLIKLESYDIDISMLEQTNQLKETNYDLDKLKKCQKDSYVTIKVEKEEKKYEFHLNY